jgi:hypothetical protein
MLDSLKMAMVGEVVTEDAKPVGVRETLNVHGC